MTTLLQIIFERNDNPVVKMIFYHLMFANNCCIFAAEKRRFLFKRCSGSRKGLGSSMDRISLS